MIFEEVEQRRHQVYDELVYGTAIEPMQCVLTDGGTKSFGMPATRMKRFPLVPQDTPCLVVWGKGGAA